MACRRTRQFYIQLTVRLSPAIAQRGSRRLLTVLTVTILGADWSLDRLKCAGGFAHLCETVSGSDPDAQIGTFFVTKPCQTKPQAKPRAPNCTPVRLHVLAGQEHNCSETTQVCSFETNYHLSYLFRLYNHWRS